MSLKRACLTHLAPQDNAFDCSKPQSISLHEPQKAPPLHEADSYYHYLDRALADPHVYNIALAGHFGCGKSTILQTYQKHYGRKRRFLNISLATFGTDASMPDTCDNEHTCADREETKSIRANGEQSASTKSSLEKRGEKENSSPTEKERRWNHHLVEHSILQQIFYQVPKSRIPRSRFKRISKSVRVLPWVSFLVWLLSVGAAVALFKPGVFSNAPTVYALITSKTLLSDILLTSGALLAVILPATVAFYALRTVTLRKLNFKSGEIEISEEKDPSALNKHLDEILYFFEETDFDVVVLEDLDRFGTTDVFTKLREINTLVNHNIKARLQRWWRYRPRRPRRVVFIYAIKDDMFTGEERTKFFDLVIPVIPVVNHINSRELLAQALRARGFSDIGDELINDVAIYVRDMRLLHNVVNEYTVYRRRLNMAGLDPEELFAMILYKNVCPEDFAKLHESTGELHACIDSKPSLVERATDELQMKQQALREMIAAADSERLRSVQELRKLYILELQRQWSKQVGHLFPLVLGEEAYQWERLAEDTPFHILAETAGHVRSSQGHSANLQFSDAEKAVDPRRTYAEREDLILSRDGKARERLEQRLTQLEDRIREHRHAKLAELLETVGQDALPPKTLPVVEMLLRQGYINETTYQSYLSYFYEGSLSTSDWVFVLGIKKGQSFEPDYAFGDVEEIVERNLDAEERIAQACKNIHVLHYIVKERGGDFAKVVDRLKRNPDEAVDLVMLYLADGTHSPTYLIQRLHRHWPEFWQTVMDSEAVVRSDRLRYVHAVILHLSAENLKAVLGCTQLQETVASDQRIVRLLLDMEQCDRAKAFLGTVRPLFLELPEMDADSSVARCIYEHGFHAVTRHNVELLHKVFVGELPDGLPPTITSLRDRDDCALAQRIDEALNDYISILVKTNDALHRETEPVVVSLLNDKRLTRETVENLVAGSCVPVERLEEIESRELWPAVLGNRAVHAVWSNVLAYHQECADGELDDALVEYLSDEVVAANLSKRRKETLFTDGEGAGLNIMAQVLASDAIPSPCVETLLKALPAGAGFDDASSVASSHLAVAHPWIGFSAGNYEHIRTHATPSIGEYVKEHLEEFYRLIPELSVTGSELASILDAHRHRKRKREIASAVCSQGLPEELAPVAGRLCELMFDDEAFAEVFEPDALAAIICAVRERQVRIEALTRFMRQLTDAGIWDVIQSAGYPYEDIAVAGKRPLLSEGELNANLADALVERGLVSKAKEDKGGIRIITFRGEE